MGSQRLIAKIESEESTLRLAVLIDADNAQAAVIEGLLAEIARFGEATVKRIYGDFTSPTSASWKKVLQKHAIKPVQQFAYTTGEEGLTVLGFGEHKTPEAFRSACHKFLFTEVLRPTATMTPATESPKVEDTQPRPVSAPAEAKIIEFPKRFVLEALEQSGDEAGWAHLGTFGSYLTKLQPDFDSRIYGYKKLSDLVKAKTELFVTEERNAPGSTQKVLYIRAKK